MNPQTTNSCLINRSSAPSNTGNRKDGRCRHFTATGRRCRLAVLDPASGLCFRHVGLQFQPSDEDLSPAFVSLLSGFRSPSRIHAFLTQVTVLLVQNRISTRRAAILAYLGQTLLRTLPAIEHELHPPEEEPQFIFDLPRPKRDDLPLDPEYASYKKFAAYNTSSNDPRQNPADSAGPIQPEKPPGPSPATLRPQTGYGKVRFRP